MNQHVKRPDAPERSAFGLKLTDAQPLSGIPAVWRLAALISTLLIGALALIGALYLGRSILLPVTAALIVGITLSPAVERGVRYGVPVALSAIAVVLSLIALIGLVITFFAAPLTGWIERAPEIGKVVQERMHLLDYPLSVMRELKGAMAPITGGGATIAVETSNNVEMVGTAVAAITPAVGQFILFFGTLVFFLVSNIALRKKLIISFGSRNARLRMMRIWNDIEDNLVSYVGLLTLINLGLGAVTAVMLYLVGFPNPVTFGLLTMALNYVPYLGPAIVALVLFAVGVVSMPSLALAALAPALFVLIATVEGHFITPSIVGRRLTISPFVVFLALAFWTWLWGPVGAFLAMPLLIVSFVVIAHVWPREEMNLPG